MHSRFLLFTFLAYLAMWFSQPLLAQADQGVPIPEPPAKQCLVVHDGCTVNTCEHGVLINGQVTTGGLPCYISTLLTQNMPYVILLAVVLIVASGIQYMVAQGGPAEQAKAKTRILGILGGIIFYFLIRYLVPLLAGGIRL